MLGRGHWGHWGQWTMGPRKTLTLHKLGQIWSDLAETPPNSNAKFIIFMNIWVSELPKPLKTIFSIFLLVGICVGRPPAGQMPASGRLAFWRAGQNLIAIVIA